MLLLSLVSLSVECKRLFPCLQLPVNIHFPTILSSGAKVVVYAFPLCRASDNFISLKINSQSWVAGEEISSWSDLPLLCDIIPPHYSLLQWRRVFLDLISPSLCYLFFQLFPSFQSNIILNKPSALTLSEKYTSQYHVIPSPALNIYSLSFSQWSPAWKPYLISQESILFLKLLLFLFKHYCHWQVCPSFIFIPW